MPKGRIKSYDAGSGLGFIAPEGGGKDVLFTRAAVVDDVSRLAAGLGVDFDSRPGHGGDAPVATRVAFAP
jgi:cold shock CspA family protein